MKWYVVYTKPGSEKKVSDILLRKKIENYIPLKKTSVDWEDNKKIKETSVFKSYVFVKTTKLQLPELKKIEEVVNLVYWLGEPVVIKNAEINAIKLFLNNYTNVHIEKTGIKSDHSVTANTTNDHQEAPLITIKNKKAYIILSSLGCVMTGDVDIEVTNVRIISREGVLNRENLKANKIINKVSEFNNTLKNYWAKS